MLRHSACRVWSNKTKVARTKAAQSDDSVVFGADGSLRLAMPDRKLDRSLPVEEFASIATAVVAATRKYHGDDRADRLHAHHNCVQRIMARYSWEVAREYDIRERESAAADPRHDLSVCNTELLAAIVTEMQFQAALATPAPLPPGLVPAKCARDTQFVSTLARKKSVAPPQLCFRCGVTGHLPAACTSSTTTAGRPVAPIATGARSGNALLAPDGRQFCFNFAKMSLCTHGDSCRNAHACSLCADDAHGAAACPRRK